MQFCDTEQPLEGTKHMQDRTSLPQNRNLPASEIRMWKCPISNNVHSFQDKWKTTSNSIHYIHRVIIGFLGDWPVGLQEVIMDESLLAVNTKGQAIGGCWAQLAPELWVRKQI